MPVVELDKPGIVARQPDEWANLQQVLVEKNEWIKDRDLGCYNVVEIRLRPASTIVFLDFSIVRCA